MNISMRLSAYYGTHLPALMVALSKTTGPVLELGMGVFSTPYLHYACLLAGRQLVSYENEPGYAKFFIDNGYCLPTHDIRIVADWDAADIERPWDVALVDHSPSERRIEDIARLAAHARYIVIHDSDDKFDMIYHYSRIYGLFRYRADWDGDYRKAAVLSNFHDLTEFWDGIREHA